MNTWLSTMLSSILIDRAGGYRRRVRGAYKDHLHLDLVLGNHERSEERRQALYKLLVHASATVPFYQRRMEWLDDLDEAHPEVVLQRLPIVDRTIMSDQRDAFASLRQRDHWTDSTGGSSGTPFSFMVDLDRRISGEASTWWSNHLAGWNPGERIAMLWGADRDVEEESSWFFVLRSLLKGDRANARSALRKQIENVRWYNSFDMGHTRMHDFDRELRKFRPHILVGYAGALYEYAGFLEKERLTPAYPLRGIVSSAEVLTPEMRARTEKVFGLKVFDRYGSREFGPLAAECEAHCGLHVNEADCYMEIDSPDPLHIPGRLLVTYLRNYSMPFIRYDTGDLALWAPDEPCACGRGTHRLARIMGRSSDLIRTASGKAIHGEYFTHLLYGATGVKAFQFVQETRDRYVLRVVSESPEAEAAAQAKDWVRKIGESVGADADVRVEYVESIPLLPSGKRKFTVSLVEGG